MKKKLMFLLMLLLCVNAIGATYCVDAATGSDSNPGTSWEEPWETTPYTWSDPRGGNTITEGDTILFKNGSYGTFREDVDDGSQYLFYRSGGYINYQAYTGHTPELTAIQIDNEDKTPTLFEGCETAWTAGSGDTVTADAAVKYQGSYSCKIVLQSEASDGDLLAYINIASKDVGDERTGLKFYMRSSISINTWDYEIVFSESANGAKTGTYQEFLCESANANTWTASVPTEDMSDLDAVISIAIYANATIANGTTIYLDSISTFGHGNSYLSFDGFFVPEGVSITNTYYVKILNCEIKREDALSSTSGPFEPYFYNSRAVYIADYHYLTIEGCEIWYSKYGIEQSGEIEDNDNITVKDNEVHTLGDDGFTIFCDNTTIDGNYIHDIHNKHAPVTIAGSIVGGPFEEGEVITQTEPALATAIVDTPPYGLDGWDLIAFATTDNLIKKTGDGGGTIVGANSGAELTPSNVDNPSTDCLALQGTNFSGVNVINNMFVREASGGKQGMKITNNSTGTISIDNFSNNVIWATKMIIGYGDGPILIGNFCNNTFCDYGDWGSGEGFVHSDLTITNAHNNLYYLTTGPGGSEPTNHDNNIYRTSPSWDLSANEIVVADQSGYFTNASAGIFTLLDEEVTPVNAGDTSKAPATDRLGNSRVGAADIGAYEFQGAKYLFGYVVAQLFPRDFFDRRYLCLRN